MAGQAGMVYKSGSWKPASGGTQSTASLSEGARGLLSSLPESFTVADAPGVTRRYRGQLVVTRGGAERFNELVTGGFIRPTDVVGPRGQIYRRS